ncbi:hypothetical protein HJC23_007032 [Cyclotella cryptica]|uniref:peptidylprolyl isomerase n=1 Tax=Cyclotella cryptica TaxID=29204 RepID=A0ABD3QMK7_9STRA|eukprot:CCRYP_004362-RA/>CCRYP_004362-RA protein AED:0.32 eAED:0.32 QI:0/-1/0/1/-1/1/1/0/559
MATESPSPIIMDVDPHPTTDGDASMADAEPGTTPNDEPATAMVDDDAPDSTTPTDEAFTSDDDSDMEKDDSHDGDDADAAADPSAALLEALTHKNAGNAHFAENSHIEASRCYRKGISLLKKLNLANSGDEQTKSLLVSLNTNLSMVCYKQQKYKLSKDAASKALEIEGENVKALFRRAVALRALGEEDAAMVDLKRGYKIDPSNVSVKKELASIKKARETQRANEKERLQKAFSSGSLLYGDKEEEEKRAQKRREREKKEKEEREEEEREKRKKEWEDDCVEKLKDGKEVLSFDQWEEERKRKEKEEREEKERARKAKEKKRREEQKAKKKQKEESDSEDELTEKELAMLRGYKKTSDGRTTSYFTREQTEKEKELIGCIQPKRLESTATEESCEVTSASAVGSVWNQAGTTWEERDTTEWCKSCLKECLLESTAVHNVENGDVTYVARVKDVDSLTGDASVAIAGGKKRYIYDFHTDVKYEIYNESDTKCIASGSLKLPDINSAHTAEEELEVDVLKWKKAPKGESGPADVEVCRSLLVGDVRKSVLRFVERFNANF